MHLSLPTDCNKGKLAISFIVPVGRITSVDGQ